MKKIPMSIITGMAVILVTVILYFAFIGNFFARAINSITLIGVVAAEIIVTLLAYFSKGDPRKVGATFFASLMVPTAIILSCIYIIKFPFGYASYTRCYFAALIIIMVIAFIIWRFSNNRSDENIAFQDAKTNMLNLRKLIKCIMIKPEAEKYKKELNAIEEKLHFSNDAVITPSDARIYEMLAELDDNISDESFDTLHHIQIISNEIDRRTILAKTTV